MVADAHRSDTPKQIMPTPLGASVAHSAVPRLWVKGHFGAGDRCTQRTTALTRPRRVSATIYQDHIAALVQRLVRRFLFVPESIRSPGTSC